MSRALVTVAAALVALAAGLPGALAQKARSGAILGGNSGKPINIEAVKLDYFDKEQKLVYTGNVIATQGDAKLRGSVLTIFLAPKKQGELQPAQGSGSANQVQRMLVKGPVTLVQRDQVGTGDNGVYDKGANTVILTGNVVLTQGPNVTKGDRLVYDLKSGQAAVTGGPGRVKSMFLPDDSSKQSSADPAPAPTSRRSARTSRNTE